MNTHNGGRMVRGDSGEYYVQPTGDTVWYSIGELDGWEKAKQKQFADATLIELANGIEVRGPIAEPI